MPEQTAAAEPQHITSFDDPPTPGDEYPARTVFIRAHALVEGRWRDVAVMLSTWAPAYRSGLIQNSVDEWVPGVIFPLEIEAVDILDAPELPSVALTHAERRAWCAARDEALQRQIEAAE
ncbi:hypothetical protein [Amycolatopsis sp. NPDC051371]|uniref:hypothetical protein n=1 Tax=Amycolatopsis sp. NPDC051371 TaxID=3155800 RepID=UPI00343500BB